MSETLRQLGPPLLAVLAALALDSLSAGRGLLPPAFRSPAEGGGRGWFLRRAAAAAVAALVLWMGVFSPLALVGVDLRFDPAAISLPDLFLLHGVFLAGLGVWWALGFAVPAGSPEARRAMSLPAQLGLRSPAPGRELALGVVAGVGVWALVLATLLALTALVVGLAGEEALPREPPEIVVWIAGLPAAVRVALALSAGLAEEVFFRGFLQPRIGIGASTLFFALAHLTYEQPFLLGGVTLLSLLLGQLVRWRQNVWPAVAAHAVFDLIQLLVVIPLALRLAGSGHPLPVALAP